jgi:DNA-binding protein YbaB
VEADPAQALAELVDRARAAMAGGTLEPPAGPFAGEAAEGQVRAEVGADGKLRSLHIEPILARRGLEEISGHVITAVNAALATRPARADTGPLLDELKAVQEQSVVEMAKISQAFSAALAQALQS